MLIDHLIQAGFYFVFIIFGAMVFGAVANRINLLGKWVLAAFIGLNFLLIWGYYTLFEAFWHGQTPGKHIMKLRVIKDSGRQITLFEAMSRNLLRIIDYLPAFYLVGVITMLCTKRHQRLGISPPGRSWFMNAAMNNRCWSNAERALCLRSLRLGMIRWPLSRLRRMRAACPRMLLQSWVPMICC